MRKEVEVKIEDGRDAGKVFKITEMPATQAERWATRALGILGKSGMSISVLGTMEFGEILQEVLRADSKDIEPMMDELLACASYENNGTMVKMQGNMIDSVIEEVTTIMKLKMEALKLILGFLGVGGESKSE